MATTTMTILETGLEPVFTLARGLAVFLCGAAICGGILLLLEPRRHVATFAAVSASLALAALCGGGGLFFTGAALACAIALAVVFHGAEHRRCVIVAAEVVLFDPEGRARAEVLRAVGAKGVLHVRGPAEPSAFGRGPTLTRLFVPCCTAHADHVALLERLRGIPGVIDVRLPREGVPAPT